MTGTWLIWDWTGSWTTRVERGRHLHSDNWCGGCHGKGVVARRGGTVPDLRYATKETHLQWNDIVIGGARSSMGMPKHDINTEDAQAIRASFLAKAWELVADSE